MINAVECKLYGLIGINKYCEDNIEPALIAAKGAPIFYGKYNKFGNKTVHFGSYYAKDHPHLLFEKDVEVSPFKIKEFLESLGYKVTFMEVKDYYEAGYSGTKRTKYYDAGYNTYYTLRISC